MAMIKNPFRLGFPEKRPGKSREVPMVSMLPIAVFSFLGPILLFGDPSVVRAGDMTPPVFDTDTTSPSVRTVYDGFAKTIVSTFNEPVQLLRTDTGAATAASDVTKDMLGIYAVTKPGTKAGTIVSAGFDDGGKVLTVTYSKALPAGTYLVYASNHNFTDLAGNALPDVQGLKFTAEYGVPDISSVTTVIGGASQTKAKRELLPASIGQRVEEMSALLNESASLVGSSGTITVTGPSGSGGSTVTENFGTFAIGGDTMTISPNRDHGTLTHAGTFVFRIAAGQFRDAAGNRNIETGFTMTVASDMTAYKAALAAVSGGEYTSESWTAYRKVITANMATSRDTQETVDAATANIVAARKDLVLAAVSASRTEDTVAPGIVKDLKAEYRPKTGNVRLTWKIDDDTREVLVYGGVSKKFSMDDDSLISRQHGDTEEYLDNSVAPGETHYYKVVARDGAGNDSGAVVVKIVIPVDGTAVTGTDEGTEVALDKSEASKAGTEATDEPVNLPEIGNNGSVLGANAEKLSFWKLLFGSNWMLAVLAVAGGWLFMLIRRYRRGDLAD